MKKIREVKNQQFTWQQSNNDTPSWELRTGLDVVGSVTWQNPKGDGTLAVATSADGSWSFKRVGVLAPRVTVRNVGTDADLATVIPHLGRSEVTFAGGIAFHFVRSNFWRNEFSFTKSTGESLLAFKENGTRVEIAPVAKTMSETSLLALLGCYLLHLYAKDAESATTAVLLSG